MLLRNNEYRSKVFHGLRFVSGYDGFLDVGPDVGGVVSI